MSIVTSQQLARYFDHFHTREVTFTRQVISATGLVARNVFLKILDRQVPCVILSSSMDGARVIASVTPVIQKALAQANNRTSLRWCFKLPDRTEPIAFFVTCTPTDIRQSGNPGGPDVNVVALQFSQRPPDDLITIIGTLLEANDNAHRRKEERIIVTPEAIRKMGLETREVVLTVDGAPHKCVLRDISFGGAMVLTRGPAARFLGKTATLVLAHGTRAVDISLSAAVRRVEEVGGGKEILAVSLEYTAEAPLAYNLMINSFGSIPRPAAGAAPKASPPAADGSLPHG
jgi:hypothetical protein